MSKPEELNLIDIYGGDFFAEVENLGDPEEKTICITVDEGHAFYSANLDVEGAKALRDWLNKALGDE